MTLSVQSQAGRREVTYCLLLNSRENRGHKSFLTVWQSCVNLKTGWTEIVCRWKHVHTFISSVYLAGCLKFSFKMNLTWPIQCLIKSCMHLPVFSLPVNPIDPSAVQGLVFCIECQHHSLLAANTDPSWHKALCHVVQLSNVEAAGCVCHLSDRVQGWMPKKHDST